MDKELVCDFYFGDTLGNKIKLMDYECLTGYRKTLRNKRLTKSGFMWQTGAWHLIFKPYKYYIITGSPSILSNWVIAIWARILGKKVYAWSHGMKNPAKKKGEIFNKYFYQLVHKVLLYGDFSKNIMINEGFKSNHLVPIYNSLNYVEQLKVRKKLGETEIYQKYFKNDYPVIAYIGRIQKSKKLDLLIFTLQQLLIKNIKCNLVLVGADIGDNEIFRLIDKLGLEENVWKHGACYDEVLIGNLLYNADVCVSPGPIGLTALHALTFGCPVITNNDFTNQMPEHEAVIPGKNGDFYVDGNLDSLVRMVEKWINLPKEKRNLIRNEAYRVIDEKWNPNHQIEIFRKLIS